VREIAEYHAVTRQRIHRIISFYKKNGFHPYLRTPGRRPERIPHDTGARVIPAQDTYGLGPILLEEQIGEEHGVLVPRDTLYRILLHHGRAIPCMTKRRQTHDRIFHPGSRGGIRKVWGAEILTDNGSQFVSSRDPQ